MAVAAGIEMNECRIYSNDGSNHFMTKRFDRDEGKKIHMQSLGAMAHISYKEPRLCSYEMAAGYMKEIGLSMKDIEQFYRRMVFNCIAVNQDDHVKNISFLMDRKGNWRLSPAYDVTFSYDTNNKWLRAHQMTINGKSENIKLEDMLSAGESFGLKGSKRKEIIEYVSTAVSRFECFAEEAKIREKTFCMIKEILDQNKA